jgi:type IV pilus assembly protein PilY1
VEIQVNNAKSVSAEITKCRKAWQRIVIWTALLSVCALPVQADDTEVYINPSTAPVTPNILFVLDLSGSMGWAPDGDTNLAVGELSRLDILKNSINQLLTNPDLPDINIGLTTFSGSSAEGVQWPALGIDDDASTYDANIPNGQTVGETIDFMVEAANDGGSTPTVDALFEAARYFRGEGVNTGSTSGFGNWESGWTNPTYNGAYNSAPNPLSYTGSSGNEEYISPITEQCQNSAILLLTDGEPTRNTIDRGLTDNNNAGNTATGDVQIRSMIANATGVTTNDITCADQSSLFGDAAWGGTSPNCAIELAEFMDSTSQVASVVGSTVTTNAIGFGLVGTSGANNWAYLQRVAAAGGGQAFLADDVTTLTTSFLSVIDSLITGNQSFRNFSSTFDVATLSTGDRAYLSMFKPGLKRAWNGNLKGYYLHPDGLYDVTDTPATELDADGQVSFKPTAKSFWSTVVDGNTPQAGGIVGNLLPSARNLYVITDPTERANIDLNNGAHNLLSANTNLTDAVLGMPVGSTAAERDALIAFSRSQKMGDPLHTRSEIVSYGGTTGSVLYIATNQGFLHAIDINQPAAVGDIGGGNEIFAFMPNELVGNLHAQSQDANTGGHIYGIDGPVTVWRQDLNADGIINNSDKVTLYFGMRRGGSAYYAMDVTDPMNPQLLWKIDKNTAGFSKMGQSWSKMTLADIKQNSVTRKALIFAGGYDADQDGLSVARPAAGDDEGLGIYIVSAETGAMYQSIGPADADGIGSNNFGIRTAAFDEMKYSIPADIKLVDSNNNGIDDRIYFADMGGQVWRIDIKESGGWAASGKFTGYRLADIGLDSTGAATAASNRRFFYAPSVARFTHNSKFVYAISLGSGYRAHPLDSTIRDKVVVLYDIDTATGIAGTTTGTVANPSPIDLTDLYNATADLVTSGTATEQTQAEQDLNAAKGWYISLEANEKVLSRTRLFRNRVLLTTFQPQASVNACDVGATTNRLYVMSLGSAAGAFPIDSNNDGSLDSNVRSQEVADQALILDEPLVVTYHNPGDPNPDPGDPPVPPETCAAVYGGAQQMLSICTSPVKVNWSTLQ